jgi:hypothetical protein
MMQRSPLFGIGIDQFAENFGKVAHNSYVHTYTELGLLGGTCYFGFYYFALTRLARLGAPGVAIRDPVLRRIRPYMTAAVASYAVSEFSITNCYLVPTYALLGLATVFIRLASPESGAQGIPFDGKSLRYLLMASGLFLLGLYILVRLLAQWG